MDLWRSHTSKKTCAATFDKDAAALSFLTGTWQSWWWGKTRFPKVTNNWGNRHQRVFCCCAFVCRSKPPSFQNPAFVIGLRRTTASRLFKSLPLDTLKYAYNETCLFGSGGKATRTRADRGSSAQKRPTRSRWGSGPSRCEAALLTPEPRGAPCDPELIYAGALAWSGKDFSETLRKVLSLIFSLPHKFPFSSQHSPLQPQIVAFQLSLAALWESKNIVHHTQLTPTMSVCQRSGNEGPWDTCGCAITPPLFTHKMTKAIMTARNTISFCSAAHILDRDCIECDIRVIIWNDLYINRYVSNLPRIKWSDM